MQLTKEQSTELQEFAPASALLPERPLTSVRVANRQPSKN